MAWEAIHSRFVRPFDTPASESRRNSGPWKPRAARGSQFRQSRGPVWLCVVESWMSKK